MENRFRLKMKFILIRWTSRMRLSNQRERLLLTAENSARSKLKPPASVLDVLVVPFRPRLVIWVQQSLFMNFIDGVSATTTRHIGTEPSLTDRVLINWIPPRFHHRQTGLVHRSSE